jgi:predicted Zn-dependent peptidase
MTRKQAPLLKSFSPDIPKAPETTYINRTIPLFHFPDKTTDIFYLGIFTKAGQRTHSHPLIPALTSHMLCEGTSSFTATELAEAIDYYGCSFMPESGKDHTALHVYAPVRHAVPVCDLLFEMFSSPVFPKKRLDLQLSQRLNNYRIERQKVRTLAMEAFAGNIFGEAHPYGSPLNESHFSNIDSQQLKEFHQQFYTPSESYFILGGNIPEEIPAMLSHLFGYDKTKKKAKTPVFALQEKKEKKVYIPVDKAVQSAIRVGFPTINKRHADYPLFQLLTFVLGGYFGSRLQRNIREEKGYTYGVNAMLASLADCGYFAVVTEAGAPVCNQTLTEIYKEIDLLKKKPVGETELNTVRQYMSGEFMRMFDGFAQNITSWRACYDFGMDYNYLKRYYQTFMKATPKQLLDIANRYFINDHFHEIVAGKK